MSISETNNFSKLSEFLFKDLGSFVILSSKNLSYLETATIELAKLFATTHLDERAVIVHDDFAHSGVKSSSSAGFPADGVIFKDEKSGSAVFVRQVTNSLEQSLKASLRLDPGIVFLSAAMTPQALCLATTAVETSKTIVLMDPSGEPKTTLLAMFGTLSDSQLKNGEIYLQIFKSKVKAIAHPESGEDLLISNSECLRF